MEAQKPGQEKQAANDAPVEAPKPPTEQAIEAALEKQFDDKVAAFQRNVTLGKWADVKAFLAELSQEEAKAGYNHLLDALRSGPGGGQRQVDPGMLMRMIQDAADPATMQSVLAGGGQGPGAAFAEKNFFSVADVVGLIVAAPAPLDDDSFLKLGTIVRQMLAVGHDLEVLIDRLKPADGDKDKKPLDARQLAKLLFASGQDVRAGDFLPKLDEARAKSDAEALNLLSRNLLALHGKENKTEILENAWEATQAVLATGEGHDKEKEQALQRAVQPAPRLRAELGQKWLDESFTRQLDRGREILTAIGTTVATSLQSRPTQASHRLACSSCKKQPSRPW